MIVDYRWSRAPKMAAMLLVIGGIVGLDAQTDASADWRQLAPWCAYLGGRDGGYDCSYHTFEQCMATARGLGNTFAPNPRAAFDPYRQPPPPRKVRKQDY